MLKKLVSFFLLCFIFLPTYIFSGESQKIISTDLLSYSQTVILLDQYNTVNKFGDSLKIFTPELIENMKTDIMWRYARAGWFYSQKNRLSKKEQISLFGKILNRIESGLNKSVQSTQNKAEMARLYYWYAVVKAGFARHNGIKASLRVISQIFEYCDTSQELDPSFHRSYYMRSQLYHRLPFFAGGSSLLAGHYAQLSVHHLPKNGLDCAVILADASIILKKRGWDINKKRLQYTKAGISIKENQIIQDDKILAKSFKALAVENLSQSNSNYIEIKQAREKLD